MRLALAVYLVRVQQPLANNVSRGGQYDLAVGLSRARGISCPNKNE